MRQIITTACPLTGKQSTLGKIAQRHGLTRSLVRSRYDLGKRGAELVVPAKPKDKWW